VTCKSDHGMADLVQVGEGFAGRAKVLVDDYAAFTDASLSVASPRSSGHRQVTFKNDQVGACDSAG